MALLQVPLNLLNDPKSMKAIYSTFEDVHEVDATVVNSLYKTFSVYGQGVPDDDRYIVVGFAHGMDGQTKISGWDFATNQTTGL